MFELMNGGKLAWKLMKKNFVIIFELIKVNLNQNRIII